MWTMYNPISANPRRESAIRIRGREIEADWFIGVICDELLLDRFAGTVEGQPPVCRKYSCILPLSVHYLLLNQILPVPARHVAQMQLDIPPLLNGDRGKILLPQCLVFIFLPLQLSPANRV